MKQSLEEYKRKVEAYLTEEVGKESASVWMKTYESDFPEFLRDGWDPKLAAQAMMAGY